MLRPTTDPSAWTWYQFSPATGTMTPDGDAIRCNIATLDATNIGNVQLYQVGPVIENGRAYRIHFAAKADKDRVMKLDGSLNHMHYDHIGIQQSVPLSKDWQTFDYVFVGENADGQPDRLPTFVLGQTTGTVWIKDVTLEVVK
jgi:hypothetical protein